jgi:hypothetical protein
MGGPIMFEMVFDNFKKAAEASLQMQQEAFKRWVGLAWPGVPLAPGIIPDQTQKLQKKWAEFYEETLTKQREAFAAQFQVGLKNIDEAFKLAQAKDPEELRTKTVELWQKVFETLRQAFEAQVRDMQSLAGRLTELARPAA